MVSDNETSVRVEVSFNCISHKTLTKQEAKRKLSNKKVKLEVIGLKSLETNVFSSDKQLLETPQWEFKWVLFQDNQG